MGTQPVVRGLLDGNAMRSSAFMLPWQNNLKCSNLHSHHSLPHPEPNTAVSKQRPAAEQRSGVKPSTAPCGSNQSIPLSQEGKYGAVTLLPQTAKRAKERFLGCSPLP